MNGTNFKTIQDKRLMRQHAAEVWALLTESYQEVEGGLNYRSVQQLINTSAAWEITVSEGHLLAVIVFKAKHGLKLVAMAVNRRFKTEAKQALKEMISARLDRCWMELSGSAERFVMNHCDGARYLLDASVVDNLLNKVVQRSSDGYHYYRSILGITKEKVALGTPDIGVEGERKKSGSHGFISGCI